MPKLYIANITQQVHNFLYSVPETEGGLRTQIIQPGSQIEISNSADFNQKQIDGIIQQHARYGLVAASEVDRAKKFTGLCYSLDKPVPIKAIEAGLEHNFDELNKRGNEIRQQSAISINNTVEDHLQREIGSTHVDIIEHDRKGEEKLFDRQTTVITRDQDREPVRKVAVERGGRRGRR